MTREKPWASTKMASNMEEVQEKKPKKAKRAPIDEDNSKGATLRKSSKQVDAARGTGSPAAVQNNSALKRSSSEGALGVQISQRKQRVPMDWGELEQAKLRVGELMDRVEYLSTAQRRLTEITAQQTRRVERAILHHSPPVLVKALHREVRDVSSMFDHESGRRKATSTFSHRLRALDRFVTEEETRSIGDPGGEAARNSARSDPARQRQLEELKVTAARLPKYDDIVLGRKPAEHQTPVVLAVKCGRPFRVPPEARNHGIKTT